MNSVFSSSKIMFVCVNVDDFLFIFSPIINEEKEDAYFIKNQQAHEDHLIKYVYELDINT